MEKPWERLEGEPDRAWAAFCLYKSQSPHHRSLRDVTEAIYGSPMNVALLGRWNTRWGWQRRVRAWDDHVRAARDREIEAVHLDADGLRREIGMDLLAVAQRETKRLVTSGQELSPRELAVLLDAGSKVLAVGTGEAQDAADGIEAFLHAIARSADPRTVTD